MTRHYPDWAYLVDESGKHWVHLENGQRQASGEASFRAPSQAIFAIPSEDLISIPQWVSSKDSTIISEVVSLETEKLGIRPDDGPGRVTDWKTVELNGSRTLIQSVSIPWALPDLDHKGTEFTNFIPQYALFTPPENAVVLWLEGASWVVGYSRGKHWAHVQPLGESLDIASISSEIQLTLLELSGKGIIETVNRVVVWTPYEMALHRSLQEATSLEVDFEKRPAPAPSATPGWEFEPHEVSRARISNTQRLRSLWFAVIGILILSLVVVSAIFHLWALDQSNRQVRQRIATNREAADVIEEAIEKWHTLSPAIDPKRSPLEIFHQISVLLPEKGFRLTSFEVQDHKTVIVKGEGAAMANTLKIKGAIENAPGLSDYVWNIPPPRSNGDLTTFFATGTYRFSTDEAE